MAIRVVKLPDIGEGVAEAEVVTWEIAVGDLVAEDQVLAAVMTNKATVEIPAPCAGTIVALGAAVGETLAVGSELVRIEAGGAPVAETPAAVAEETRPPPPRLPSRPPERRPAVAPAAVVGAPRPPGDKPLAAPSVRQRAREAGVDLRQVRGGGPAGRIRHEDLDRFLQGNGEPASSPGARRPNGAVEEVRVVGLRRQIARNMAESKRRVAHFSYVEEVDVTALEALRATLNERHPTRARLTLLPFLMQAIVRAIADHPQVNAHYDDEAGLLRRFGAAHIGIATQTPAGLMVPVVRHAEARDLWELAAEVKRRAEAARQGLAQAEELTGSTITVSSLGALGGIMSTPVVNRPEVAVVGVNKQAIRPVWVDKAFVPRRMMNLSSSFDHRVVDGADAAGFIQTIKGLLEEPAMMFI